MAVLWFVLGIVAAVGFIFCLLLAFTAGRKSVEDEKPSIRYRPDYTLPKKKDGE